MLAGFNGLKNVKIGDTALQSRRIESTSGIVDRQQCRIDALRRMSIESTLACRCHSSALIVRKCGVPVPELRRAAIDLMGHLRDDKQLVVLLDGLNANTPR